MEEALKALGFNGKVLLLNTIAFLILFGVLWRYLFRPLSSVMETRSKEIAEGLEAAQRHKQALAQAEEEKARVLTEAREQGRERIRQAVREADEARERMLAEAREEAQSIRERGREAVELEREQALAEVRKHVVDLALLAASRAVVQRLDERVHRHAVEQFINGLEGKS